MHPPKFTRPGAAIVIALTLGTVGLFAGPAHAGESTGPSLDIPCTVLGEGALEALPDLQNCLIVTFDEGEWDGEKAVSTLGLSYGASELAKSAFMSALQDWLSEHEGIVLNGVMVTNVQIVGDTASYDAVRVADDFLLRNSVVDAGSYPDVEMTLTEY